MAKYNLSVIDLGQPTPKIGSIDTHSGFGATSKLAIKAHQLFQSHQLNDSPNYSAEVSIIYSIHFKRTVFNIAGRMDGFYQEQPARIEEIKTAFDPFQLIDTLAENYFTHPYWLQLQIYGYIHWLKTNTIPQLNLLIISLRNQKKTYPLFIDFDLNAFEQWLDMRLDELITEIKESKQRIIRRKKQSIKLVFPFENPRRYQKELMESVTSAMSKKKPMLFQAPTGLGKSIAILYPALKESLYRGQKTIYLTPKNSQHQIALNTVRLLQSKGSACKSLILTAKKKLCMKNEPICNSKHCEFANNHYSKCTANNLLKKVHKRKNADERFFKKLATDYQICPYELQMDSIPLFDVVIGDYNYVFSSTQSNSRITTMLLGERQKPNLVIDEVHNLPQRGMDYFSPSLAVKFFETYLTILTNYPALFQKKLTKIVNQCITTIRQCALPAINKIHLVKVSIQSFKQQEEALNKFLSYYLESDLTIEINDPILKLCNYWSEFTAALELINPDDDEFFISYDPVQAILKINCADASSFLKEHYNNFQQVIGFSATLKPFNYYSQLIGLNTPNLYTEEFSTPFSSDNRKLLLIPQVSTKYNNRQANYAKIVAVITRISSIRPGNYFIFFPSFDFLEQVFQQMTVPLPFTVLRQERKMTALDIKNLLNKLHQEDTHHLFFAVQGGVFSEGLDYIGELAIGAFIVGPSLPSFSWEREQMKKYYETRYNAGQAYAYIYPAMAKSIQAAGRVIRTETDKGLIVLLDNRFLHPLYNQCMPNDWFTQSPQELVSQSILKDVELFWTTI